MYDDIIAKWSAAYNIPIPWIEAVIATESSWVASAVNSGGDRGLMQISPPTANAYGITDLDSLFDPDLNIETGTHILADIRMRVGDDVAAIYSAYNSGNPNSYLTNSTVGANVSRFLNNLSNYIQQNPLVSTLDAGGIILIGAVLMFLWTKGKRKG